MIHDTPTTERATAKLIRGPWPARSHVKQKSADLCAKGTLCAVALGGGRGGAMLAEYLGAEPNMPGRHGVRLALGGSLHVSADQITLGGAA